MLMVDRISTLFCVIRRVIYKFQFGGYGHKSTIVSPLKIIGKDNIYIGNHVTIKYKVGLGATSLKGSDCKLIIEDGCVIGNFNHIFATKEIILHKNVLTADRVYISDNMHGYENIHVPIMHQDVVQKSVVEIGEGSWIGENVCIIGANIGRNCVIGANSVVTHDIPDYSIAVGVPARVIKQYDTTINRWRIV